ncbi:MAG: tRNA (adenosine(37)-N6)-dimethylallyltransferase MiaA [Clostridia bacterium]|nr:tRNA (adenosine(37)-N6)-dimethylallyltransferase MiaA [Clostridia bacterium]
MKDKIVCIVGPTASGKTGLSIELAKKINAEIISADSMQIYKDLTIGTAKVTEEEKQGIKHHIIDICNPGEKFSVADFKNLCYDKIKEIIARGKKVIIVGGTGLYVSAVVDNMCFDNEEIDFVYRKELEELAAKESNDYLYDMLIKIDPESAKVIHKNNVKRVIRALEIAKSSKELKSVHMNKEVIRKQQEKEYDFYVFCMNMKKELLHERINTRIDLMLQQGIIEEAKKLYELNLDKDCTCMQAIGYKEFFPYFNNSSSLEGCVEKLKLETRRYAKRQMTWFKNKLSSHFLDATKEKKVLICEILEILNN